VGKQGKPAIYHCISRVVDRRFVFGDAEREYFRMFMRMQENFTGCRVLTYCVMSNHFHVLLEVPPVPEGGISDDLLLKRLAALYSEAFVAGVAQELENARKEADEAMATEIHARFSYRMHDLSEFMKTLLQRFTRWFNREHDRRGTLWEERYKSVIVESGVAARTIAAYIDLNPVRAGMVSDPADYRWSGYGEAVGGGAKGNGKKARFGLILAVRNPEARDQTAMDSWKEVSRIYRRAMGLALGRKNSNYKLQTSSKRKISITKNEAEMLESQDNETVLPDLGMAGMLMKRVRYFTDGAVIGSKAFVNEAFAGARERFSDRRKDGARRMRGEWRGGEGGIVEFAGFADGGLETQDVETKDTRKRGGVTVQHSYFSSRPCRILRSLSLEPWLKISGRRGGEVELLSGYGVIKSELPRVEQ
jgi:REP element-mobilizing transposase RayT